MKFDPGKLIEAARKTAIDGAHRWLRKAAISEKTIDARRAELHALVDRYAQAAMDEAMRDAMLATSAGMHDAAAATFNASMLLAGIAAAKKWAGVK